jgi:ATP-binding protein involved in chromosome partitioning
VQSIREGGDRGVPVVLSDDEITKQAFLNFSAEAERQIAIINSTVSEKAVVTA